MQGRPEIDDRYRGRDDDDKDRWNYRGPEGHPGGRPQGWRRTEEGGPRMGGRGEEGEKAEDWFKPWPIPGPLTFLASTFFSDMIHFAPPVKDEPMMKPNGSMANATKPSKGDKDRALPFPFPPFRPEVGVL